MSCVRPPDPASLAEAIWYSQTILLVFTPLLLLTVALMSVALLSGIGGEKLPSTLNLSMGGGHKRD